VAHDHTLMIAVVGAESTGKTTLCEQLARKLGGLWVPEYLRDFCNIEGRTPRVDEQQQIINTQIAHEAAARFAAQQLGLRFVFCDTTPLMTAIYSELLFNDSSHINFTLSHQQRYALTFFLQADIGWQVDEQRDGEHVQPIVTAMLTKHLKAHSLLYVPINGAGDARLEKALLELRRLSA
jgi:nicotinamide riboside kinase